MVVHESTGVRLVDQGWLCGGRGLRGDDAAGHHNDCPAATGNPTCVSAGASSGAARRSVARRPTAKP